MNPIASPTFLIVPGLRDHMPDHWQTILEKKLPNARAVPRRSQDKLSCAAWVADLDRSLADIDGPVVLVAHSGGVMMVVHWAQHHSRPIRGALLAAPADLESPLPEGYPSQEALRQNGWLPIPRSPLPFPSIVAASTNDPLGALLTHRRIRYRLGKPPRRPRRCGSSQSRIRVRRVAAGRDARPRAVTRAC